MQACINSDEIQFNDLLDTMQTSALFIQQTLRGGDGERKSFHNSNMMLRNKHLRHRDKQNRDLNETLRTSLS